MPDLADYFHYRHLDVSTLKRISGSLETRNFRRVQKGNTHLALDDIRESIKRVSLLP